MTVRNFVVDGAGVGDAKIGAAPHHYFQTDSTTPLQVDCFLHIDKQGTGSNCHYYSVEETEPVISSFMLEPEPVVWLCLDKEEIKSLLFSNY